MLMLLAIPGPDLWELGFGDGPRKASRVLLSYVWLGCDVWLGSHPTLFWTWPILSKSWIRARFFSKPLKRRALRSGKRATHGFVRYVLKDSGYSRQVAFQIWSCPEKHVKRSWRLLWRPKGPKFPSMACKQGYIPWSLQGIPSPDQCKQSEYLALWGPWEHHKAQYGQTFLEQKSH